MKNSKLHERIHALKNQGLTLKEITSRLASEGASTRKGTPVSYNYIRAISALGKIDSLTERANELMRKELVLEALEALQKKDVKRARENLLKVLEEWK